MKIHHHILALSGIYFRLVRRIKRLTKLEGPQLRVLLYHDVPSEEMASFRKQLESLARHWQFLTPSEFSSVMSGGRSLAKDSLLLTFDDGFLSNRKLAEEVLTPLGIKAIFFLVPHLMSTDDRSKARAFIAKHIYPLLTEQTMPANWNRMTWEDAYWLVEQGHEVGCHTMSHARLSDLANEEALHSELIESADLLSNRLGVKVHHCAYTFGNLASISPAALTIAAQRYRFVYSGLRGCNTPTTSHLAIRRESVTSSDSNLLVSAYLAGAADFVYRSSCRTLDSWARDIVPDSRIVG